MRPLHVAALVRQAVDAAGRIGGQHEQVRIETVTRAAAANPGRRALFGHRRLDSGKNEAFRHRTGVRDRRQCSRLLDPRA